MSCWCRPNGRRVTIVFRETTRLPADDEPAAPSPAPRRRASSPPRQAERRLEASGEHARLRGAWADGDDLAGLLRRVEQTVRAERERGRTLQSRRVDLGHEAAADLQRGRRAERRGAGHGDEEGGCDGSREATSPRDRRQDRQRSVSAACGGGGPAGASARLCLGSATISARRELGDDRLRLGVRAALDDRRLDDRHVPRAGRVGGLLRAGIDAGGAISSRRQRERFAAAAHSASATSDPRDGHHEHDPGGGEVGQAGKDRDEQQERRPRREPRHRRSGAQTAAARRPPSRARARGRCFEALSRPASPRPRSVRARIARRGQRLQLGAQLGRDRLELAHAIGERREGLLDSRGVVPLVGVRQLVGLRQLAHPP